MSSQDRSTESLLADTALATGETVAAGTDGMVGGGLRAHQLSADDRYRASSLLGVGGMGEVLLYRDGRIGRVGRHDARQRDESDGHSAHTRSPA